MITTVERQLPAKYLIVPQMILGDLSAPLEIKSQSQALFMIVALGLRSPGA